MTFYLRNSSDGKNYYMKFSDEGRRNILKLKLCNTKANHQSRACNLNVFTVCTC